MGYVSFFLC